MGDWAGAYKTEVADKEYRCSCGSRMLEEVMMCVTQVSSISFVDLTEGQLMADADYFDTLSESGDLEEIRCEGCKKFVADSYEDLLKLADTDPRFTPAIEEIEESTGAATGVADSSMGSMAMLTQILDVPFTFSIHCRSGFVPNLIERCECFRCRKERGEPRNDELAAAIAAEADRRWALVKDDWIKRMSSEREI